MRGESGSVSVGAIHASWPLGSVPLSRLGVKEMRVPSLVGIILTISGFVASCDNPPAEYRVTLDGQPADMELVATVTWPPGEYAGFIEDSAFCGQVGYLMNRDSVHWIDLATGEVLGQIGGRGQGPGEWEHAASVAADCERGMVYVVDTLKGALAFSFSTGEYLDTISKPALFAPGGGHAGAAHGELWVPGLWPSDGRDITTVRAGSGMYQGAELGWRVSADHDAGTSIAAAIAEDCYAIQSSCFTHPIDRFTESGSSYWFVGQGASTRAHVLDGDGRLVTSVDVRSPRFERDGTRARLDVDVAQEMRWGLTNSAVQGVFAWKDTLAVVHMLRATENWTLGQVMQFEVFLNLFSSSGEPLVADLKLPDFSIGRSEEYIYFLDYGEAGRRRNVDQIDIRRISLPRLRGRWLGNDGKLLSH